jgi:hypothetical protein
LGSSLGFKQTSGFEKLADVEYRLRRLLDLSGKVWNRRAAVSSSSLSSPQRARSISELDLNILFARISTKTSSLETIWKKIVEKSCRRQANEAMTLKIQEYLLIEVSLWQSPSFERKNLMQP